MHHQQQSEMTAFCTGFIKLHPSQIPKGKIQKKNGSEQNYCT